MKKIIYALLVGVIIFTLCACSQNKHSTMYIKPSELSDETMEVLDLFDNEIQFFDISFDETVKSYAISVWVYRDGEWAEDGMTVGNIDHLTGRIAVRLTETSCDLYTMLSTVFQLWKLNLMNPWGLAEQKLIGRHRLS